MMSRSFSKAPGATASQGEDALHAWALAIDAFDLGEGLVMYVGPDRSGRLLEVGVIDWHGHTAIAHAMVAHPKFVR